jgi:hypothetical protein
MTNDIRGRALEAAEEEIGALLVEQWPEICKAMDAAAIQHAYQSDKPFAYRVAVAIELRPAGDSCHVRVKLAYTVAHKAESEGVLVSDQAELDFDGEGLVSDAEAHGRAVARTVQPLVRPSGGDA